MEAQLEFIQVFSGIILYILIFEQWLPL